MKRLISAVTSFFQSLFGRSNKSERTVSSKEQDVDEVASKFYRDILDSEAKRKS
jgi:hypothetical protein